MFTKHFPCTTHQVLFHPSLLFQPAQWFSEEVNMLQTREIDYTCICVSVWVHSTIACYIECTCYIDCRIACMLLEFMQQEYDSTVYQHCKTLFSCRVLAMCVCKHVHYYSMLHGLYLCMYVWCTHSFMMCLLLNIWVLYLPRAMIFSKSLDLFEPQLQQSDVTYHK